MMVAEFSFFKKYNHQIQHLVWAFEHKFCPEGGTLNKPISSEEKGEGVGGKLQIDQCINNKKTNKQTKFWMKFIPQTFYGNSMSLK